MKEFVFTSESVSEGHPDKVCDRISDSILDAFLAEDPFARVAMETLATTNRVVLSGEVRGALTNAQMEEIAREAVRQIGYEQDGFHWKNMQVDVYVHSQSEDIARGVDDGVSKEEGAGDQGIMFGYACRETPELMPAPIQYAHRILQELANLRHNGLDILGPDSKSQVSLLYHENKPIKATSVVVSTQHSEGVSTEEIREIVRPVVLRTLPDGWMCDEKDFYVNPTGRFVVGGPDGDTGLTGRKIIVDTYGGMCPHGGGAFSGKDPTKVDRSAAYIARYLAKNIVASGIADKCTIQLSYAIGVAKPLSVYVDFDDHKRLDDAHEVANKIGEIVDLTPRGIRTKLQLNRPIYTLTSAYGHFGRQPGANGEFSWEKLDLVEALRTEFGHLLIHA